VRGALLLDRDGTLNREIDYLADPEDLELIGGAAEAIARARQAGHAIVVITNQSGIARGLLTEERLTEIHTRLDAMLAAADPRAVVDMYYACPHHPEHGPPAYRQDCTCRKPKPGMLLDAIRDLGFDPAQSAQVGDSVRDLDAARAAGVPARYLVATGKGQDQRGRLAPDDRFVPDVLTAVEDWLARPT